MKKSRFSYLEFGDRGKPTLLLLHGAFDSARMFKKLGSELVGEYHVIALDFPMIHEQSRIHNTNSLADFVEGFIREIELKKFTLAGFSLGGLVAIEYSCRNPERVEKLYVLNSFPFFLVSKCEFVLAKLLKPLLICKPVLFSYSLLRTSNMLRRIMRYPRLSEFTYKRTRKSFISVCGTVINILDVNLMEKFNKLSVEKILILCKDDHVLKWKRYYKFIELLDCDIKIFNKGGHALTKNYWKEVEKILVG